MQEGLLVTWVESKSHKKSKTYTLFFEDREEGYAFVKTKSAVIQCQRIPMVKARG